MKLAVVTTNAVSSDYQYVRSVAGALSRMGCEVTLYVRNVKRSKIAHITKESSFKEYLFPSHNIFFSLRLFFALSFRDVQVVHILGLKLPVLALFFGLVRRKTLFIATCFASQKVEDAGVIKTLYDRLTCSLYDAVFVVGRSLQRAVWKHYGLKSVFIPQGTSLPEKREEIGRITLDAMDLVDKRYLLYVGDFTKSGGAHFLIELFKNAQKGGRLSANFKLILVNDGNRDEEYYQYMRCIAQENRYIVFTENIQTWQRHELIAHASLIVDGSSCEHLSETLLESLSLEVPVFARDIPDVQELFHAQTLTLFEPGNGEDMRDKVQRFIYKPGELEDISEELSVYAEKIFSWSAIAGRIYDTYYLVAENKLMRYTSRFISKRV